MWPRSTLPRGRGEWGRGSESGWQEDREGRESKKIKNPVGLRRKKNKGGDKDRGGTTGKKETPRVHTKSVLARSLEEKSFQKVRSWRTKRKGD